MIYRRGPQSQGSPYPQRIVNGNTFGWGGSGVATWIWGLCFPKKLPFLSLQSPRLRLSRGLAPLELVLP